MKLEVGMYVRTEDGEIFKTDNDLFYLSNDKSIFYRKITRIPNESINYKVSRVSANLIDLIEVGDYVNGCEVIEVIDTDTRHYLRIDVQFQNSIYESEIKSIVTKEQFEKMAYRVGD